MNRHNPCLSCARVSVGAAMWALVLVTGACRHAPPVASVTTNAEPSHAELDQRLTQVSWFPADVRDLSYFRGDRSPMLQWLDNSPIPLPSCYRELRPSIDSHYMVTPLAGGGAVNVMHGQLDRDRMESCFSLAANALQLTVEVHRQGQLSEFITSNGGRHYAGWTSDGWLIYHDDRARVEQFLQRTSALHERIELTTLLRYVDSGATRWGISTADMTGRLLGVPSEGYVLTFSEDTKHMLEFHTRIFFARTQEAERAGAALREQSKSDRWSIAAKQTLASLNPKITDRQMTIIIGSEFLRDPKVLQEFQAALTQLQQAGKARPESP